MPLRYHKEDHLSARHTNELFRLIETSGVPITEFELVRSTVTVTRARISIDRRIGWWWANYSWPVTIIYHGRTRSHLAIAIISSERFATWGQVDARRTGEDFFSPKRVHPRNECDWKEITTFAQDWVDEVKEAVRDLWEQLGQGGGFLDAEPGQGVDNTPFTHDEQDEISTRIKRAKEYLRASGELTSGQISHIETRLDHAEEASKRIGRKDWLMMFNGAVFSLILTDTITPQVAQHIFTLVVHGLGHFFGYGGPPPHLPGS